MSTTLFALPPPSAFIEGHLPPLTAWLPHTKPSLRLPSLTSILNPTTSPLAPIGAAVTTYNTSSTYYESPSPTTSYSAGSTTSESDFTTHQDEVAGQCLDHACLEPVKHRGYCKKHGGARRCAIPGCTKGVQGGSLCIGHG
ncbi:hypothetical protein As57867_007356, partial [Aphanomyces stellatus]